MHQAEPPIAADPTFSLLFEVLVLIQEADVGLRAQRDVVFISPVVTATVLLLLLGSSLASSLQQLLELRFHQRPSEPSRAEPNKERGVAPRSLSRGAELLYPSD